MTDERQRILRLTERVRCAGWASKLGPSELAQVLGALPTTKRDPRVLVDFGTGDDAGVFRLDEETALVQTVDFFTPVVDDPETYGRIAAANALSDVYAMGGRPLTALAIAAFPETDFPPEWAAAIVRGGALVLAEAGCALLGGHSVRDPEVKFGYAVTGLVEPARLLTNGGGHAGEVLVLTKPIGTGIVATALKAGGAPEPSVEAATRSMLTLNRDAAEAALAHGVRGATDVTGFGLVGHAAALARHSGVTLEIDAALVPVLPGAEELTTRYVPAGLAANERAFAPDVEYRGTLTDGRRLLLHDPQTSGGLLLLVPGDKVGSMQSSLPLAKAIGRAVGSGPKPLIVQA